MFNKLVKAKNSKKGFTLIEVMVVVAIIAILAAVAIPAYLSYKKESQIEVAKSSFSAIVESVNGLITMDEEYDVTDFDGKTIQQVKAILAGENLVVVTDSLDETLSFTTYAKLADGNKYFVINHNVPDESDDVDCWLDLYVKGGKTDTATTTA